MDRDGQRGDFFDSGGMSSRILFSMNGLESALHFVLELVRDILPVARINILCAATDLSVFVPVADTSPQGVNTVIRRKRGKGAPFLEPGHLGDPLLISELEPYKRQAVTEDTDNKDLPFLSHRALLRFPLFARGDFLFLCNFWSDAAPFRPEHLESLQRLMAPLAGELAEKFSSLNGLRGLEVAGMAESGGYESLCRCAGLARVRQAVERVAPTRCTVLITGETGVGKEYVAEALHELSPRRTGPLVKVNCGAIAESLVDSELFGHEKGSFTGADATRSGYFELADGGTLFLDEVGELPPSAQVRLLRVLSSRAIQRVGNPKAMPVDVRVVAATNRDLAALVEEGRFRQDLYYRLAVYPLEVPPLRRRKADIPTLTRYFLALKAKELGIALPPEPAQAELDKLYMHDWPGNVRELEHVVERALIDARVGQVTAGVSFDPGTRRKRAEAFEDWPSLAELTDRYMEAVLDKTGGRLTGPNGAAGILGIHYTTLRAHLNRMGKTGIRKNGGGADG